MAKANEFYPQEVEINQIQNSDGDVVLDVVNETVAADVIHVDESNVETVLVDINEMHVNADLVHVSIDNSDPLNPVEVVTNIIDADTQTVTANVVNATSVNNADITYTDPGDNSITTLIDASTGIFNGKLNGSSSEIDIERDTDNITVASPVIYISETNYGLLTFTGDNPTGDFNALYLIHEDA